MLLKYVKKSSGKIILANFKSTYCEIYVFLTRGIYVEIRISSGRKGLFPLRVLVLTQTVLF